MKSCRVVFQISIIRYLFGLFEFRICFGLFDIRIRLLIDALLHVKGAIQTTIYRQQWLALFISLCTHPTN